MTEWREWREGVTAREVPIRLLLTVAECDALLRAYEIEEFPWEFRDDAPHLESARAKIKKELST
jgi:hypothetical protein